MIKNIYFIYPRAHRTTGSTVMRTFQAADILKSYSTAEPLAIETRQITNLRTGLAWHIWCRTIKNQSLAVFCKDAIDRLPRKMLPSLQNRDIKIAVDYIDKSLDGFEFSGIDIHIASSSKQAAFLKSLAIDNKKIFELFHLGDQRLYNKDQSKIQKKGIVYYGELQNTYIPEKLINLIEIMPYNGFTTEQDLQKLCSYKFLYCIRDPKQNRSVSLFKPTTKIMNSIALLTPPIVTLDMDGVINILGSEYPFMAKINSDEEIQRILNLAINDEQAYIKAVEILKQCKKKYNPNTWSNNFLSMVKKIDV